MNETERKLIKSLAESVSLMADLMSPVAAPILAASVPQVSNPATAKRTIAKPPRKLKRRRASVPPVEPEEDEDDDEPAEQKTTRAVSIGEVVETISRHIARKVGVGQSFTNKDLENAFDFAIEPTTLSAAAKQLIDQGYIERTVQGNRWKPSTFKKLRAFEQEY